MPTKRAKNKHEYHIREIGENMKIEILALNEMPDGSLNADINYDDEAAEYIKSVCGVTELTPEVLSRFVSEALHNYVEDKVEVKDPQE